MSCAQCIIRKLLFPHVRQIIPRAQHTVGWEEKFPYDALSTAHRGTHSGNQHGTSHAFQVDFKVDAHAPAPAAAPAAAPDAPAAAAKLQRKPPTTPVFAIKHGDIFS